MTLTLHLVLLVVFWVADIVWLFKIHRATSIESFLPWICVTILGALALPFVIAH